jgi:hypothetical protein
MVVNVGSADRFIRIAAAVALGWLALAGVVTMTWAIVAGTVAAVLLVTGVFGWCPFYAAFHVSSIRAVRRS